MFEKYLEKITIKLSEYLNTSFSGLEVKIIGSFSAITLINNFLENKNTVVVLDEETAAETDDSIDFGML